MCYKYRSWGTRITSRCSNSYAYNIYSSKQRRSISAVTCHNARTEYFNVNEAPAENVHDIHSFEWYNTHDAKYTARGGIFLAKIYRGRYVSVSRTRHVNNERCISSNGSATGSKLVVLLLNSSPHRFIQGVSKFQPLPKRKDRFGRAEKESLA